MRILLAVHHDKRLDSGASGTVLELAAAYRAAGHQAEVLSYDDFPVDLPLRAKELTFPELASWRFWRAAGQFDVIDASTGDAWIWARLRGLRAGRPLLVTRSHGLEHVAHETRLEEAREGRLELSWRYPIFYGGWRLWEVAESLRRADLVFMLNEHDVDYAVGNLGVPADRCRVVRNGLPDYLIGLPDPSPSDPVRIAVLGSHIARKGVGYSMPALGAALERHPGLKLSLLGTGLPAEEVLVELPGSVHDRVHVVERYRRQDLPELLADHQMTVFASLSEGFGKTVLEAMACGLAPICARSPGPTQFVEDWANGVLFTPRDPGELAAAIDRLLDDPALLARLRTAAHRTAQRFSWHEVARERLELYENGLAGTATREAVTA